VIPLATVAQYASVVAGRPVAIVCEQPWSSPYDGWVTFINGQPVPVIHLKSDLCALLTHADSNPWVSPGAFLVLIHEAEHINLSSTDECYVEKVALANIWTLVRLFKLAAWRTNAILQGAAGADSMMPGIYHGC
jgi:hypothetical protein